MLISEAARAARERSSYGSPLYRAVSGKSLISRSAENLIVVTAFDDACFCRSRSDNVAGLKVREGGRSSRVRAA